MSETDVIERGLADVVIDVSTNDMGPLLHIYPTGRLGLDQAPIGMRAYCGHRKTHRGVRGVKYPRDAGRYRICRECIRKRDGI